VARRRRRRRRRRTDNATSRPHRWRDAPLDEPPGALCPGRSCVIALTSRVTTTCLQARSVRLTTPLTPDLAGSEPMGPSEPGLVWSRSATPRCLDAPREHARRRGKAFLRAAAATALRPLAPRADPISRLASHSPRTAAPRTAPAGSLVSNPLPATAPRTAPPSGSPTAQLLRPPPGQAPTTRPTPADPPPDDRATDSTVDAVHQPLPTYGRPPDRHPPASPPRAPPTYDRATCSTVQQAHQPLPTCGRPPDSHRPAGPHRPTPRTAAPQTAPTRWLMPATAPHSGALKPTEQHGLLPCVRRSPTGSASGPRQGAPPGVCAWSHREPQA